MSLEHSPARDAGAAAQGGAATLPEADLGYWNGLIDERSAASFLGMTDRFMQSRRQQGGGPRYISISARCIRYRRIDLRAWSEARLKSSTSDPGAAAA